ncbi:hypothetical protein [Kitasatospora sp. NPDC057223]|uniref:hypothetical protein n=1 Tax=Kitasatospora sp. NPDC057223 TaxID=3346055 RepID=UPI0036447EA7
MLALLLLSVEGVGFAATLRSGAPVGLQALHQPLALLPASAAVFLLAVLKGTLPGERGIFWLALAAVVVVLAFSLPLLSSTPDETERHAAPGRADRVLVLEDYRDFEYSYVQIYVEQGSGPTARRWYAGGVSLDDLAGVGWDGPDRIKVTHAPTEKKREVQLVELAPDGAPRTRAK